MKSEKILKFEFSNRRTCTDPVVSKASRIAQTPGFVPASQLGSNAVVEHKATLLNPKFINIDAPDGETFMSNINTEEEFNKYLIVDGNEDGVQWLFSAFTGAACLNSTQKEHQDDWLISEGFQLEAGKRYVISTSVNAPNAPVWVEKFELKIGKERSAEGMTETVMETMVVDFDAYQSHGNYFTPTESGTYYLGVHCVSDYDQGFLAVNQIKVSSPNAVALPTDIEYEEVPLIESDFSNIGGSWDAPIDIADSSKLYMNEYYALTGLEGWHGQNVKAAGDCLIIKRINGDQDQQAKIVPPLTKAEGFESVRISMDLKVKEHSARSTGYNKLEFFEGDFMVGTSEIDNAWRWYNTDVSLDDYPLNANEWKTIPQLVPMPTESKNLWGYDDAGNSTKVVIK